MVKFGISKYFFVFYCDFNFFFVNIVPQKCVVIFSISLLDRHQTPRPQMIQRLNIRKRSSIWWKKIIMPSAWSHTRAQRLVNGWLLKIFENPIHAYWSTTMNHASLCCERHQTHFSTHHTHNTTHVHIHEKPIQFRLYSFFSFFFLMFFLIFNQNVNKKMPTKYSS